MLYLNKTRDALVERVLARISQAGITDVKPGSVAHLIVSAICEELSEDNPDGLYALVKAIYAQAFVSTASGSHLDKIAAMFNLKRSPGESDDDFRYRITRAVTAAEAGNETAIRMAALSVPGVRNVILKPFTSGPGSGSVYVVCEDYTQVASTLSAVKNAVMKVAPFGTKIDILIPELSYVVLHIKLMFKQNVSQAERDNLKRQVQDAIRRYVNGLMPGEPFIIADVTQRVKDISTSIVDYSVIKFTVNGIQCTWANRYPEWNEQLIEAPEVDAIKVY